MAHEFLYADITHAPQHVCLTLPLRDYCIGHRLVFMHQRNPLVFGVESDFNALPIANQILHLIEAVTVCNQSYANRVQFEKSPTRWLLWKFKRDSDKWRSAREKEQKKFESLDAYWSSEIAAFRNYLNSNRIVTDYKSRREPFPFLPCGSMPDSKGRSLGGPYDATLIQFLIQAQLCVDSASAMEYPFALAELHYLTHLEREGHIRIMNDQEIYDREQCDARDLEAAKQAGFDTVEEHVAHITGNARKNNEAAAQAAQKTGLATDLPAELTTKT